MLLKRFFFKVWNKITFFSPFFDKKEDKITGKEGFVQIYYDHTRAREIGGEVKKNKKKKTF